MNIQNFYSLKAYNTFGVECSANHLVEYDSEDELRQWVLSHPQEKSLCIGEGSNLLFIRPFEGTILRSRMCRARVLRENPTEVWVEAEAGLKLDDLIQQLVDMNVTGMENLSYIPGTVGASAVQNVGAYGVEAKDVIEEVRAMSFRDGTISVFTNSQLQFDYRFSAFKQALKGRYIILSVTYHLYKDGPINLSYQGVKEALAEIPNPTAKDVREAIIRIRKSKLPEVSELGSAGSFFKNPVIPLSDWQRLMNSYPNMPYHMVQTGYKIPAAWLIENAHCKDLTHDHAAVYEKNPVVLVNKGNATGEEIACLAREIIDRVDDAFKVTLQPEVEYVE